MKLKNKNLKLSYFPNNLKRDQNTQEAAYSLFFKLDCSTAPEHSNKFRNKKFIGPKFIKLFIPTSLIKIHFDPMKIAGVMKTIKHTSFRPYNFVFVSAKFPKTPMHISANILTKMHLKFGKQNSKLKAIFPKINMNTYIITRIILLNSYFFT